MLGPSEKKIFRNLGIALKLLVQTDFQLLRDAEAVSLTRATALNLHTVQECFNNLREARLRHHYPSQNIFDADEKDLVTVQTPGKIIASPGQKQEPL